MTEDQLIQRTADAIKRDSAAHEAFETARVEADEARKELRDAWTALRDHQDKQVALRLVA
jgi:hypothetical protein